MASGRRGAPPDLKTTLGSLLRTTLEQVGAVKEAVEQQTRGRGGLLDQALVQRRRKDAMAKLGEVVHRMARAGTLGELALDPKIGMCLEEIDSLEDDESWSDHDDSFGSHEREAVSSASYAPTTSRADSEKPEFRVWRPVRPGQESEKEEPAEPAATEPVSQRKSRSARLPRKTAQRSGSAIRFVEESVRPEDPDCDDDLDSYMHEDDVPDKD